MIGGAEALLRAIGRDLQTAIDATSIPPLQNRKVAKSSCRFQDCFTMAQ
jgi:hypothetical protein